METEKLERELEKIHATLIKKESVAVRIGASVHPLYTSSAKNLYRYLLLRSKDIRKIQNALSELGISSLGTGAGYVYSNVFAALKLVKLINGKRWKANKQIETIGFSDSKALLVRHANLLFNTESLVRDTEIMVTMQDERTNRKKQIRKLVLAGMGIARINLSHGDPKIWKKILHKIHAATPEGYRPTQVYMDLPGPKIRIDTIYHKTGKGTDLKTPPYVKIDKGTHILLIKLRPVTMSTEDNNPQLSVAHILITVSLPQIIEGLQQGHSVFFDDGAIEVEVVSSSKDAALLVVKKSRKKKLRPGKGINLPQTNLELPSLTKEDLELLPFIKANAQLMGYSFVQTPEDVAQLYGELNKIGDQDTGVIFKIENSKAFQNLPSILLKAMQRPKVGVMIARGDLAVEVGFERISEVQSEILWLCEAAQIPVIWATQVLDNLAKKGMATRAEISDATISAQAECVMLNKGRYILEATKTLRNVLRRMEAHSQKSKNTLRALKVAKTGLKNIHKEYRIQ